MEQVVFLTSVHPHDDIRIFQKEARTLVRAGYEVRILNPEFDGEKNGVRFERVNVPVGRLGRILVASLRMWRRARKLSAAAFHLHDPELLLCGLLLEKSGKRVVYDAHEDLPKQLLSKPYLTGPLRRLLAALAARVERRCARRFDLCICATQGIAERYASFNPNTVTVWNFPQREEVARFYTDYRSKQNYLCYIGELSRIRGVVEMVKALQLCDAKLFLAGRYDEQELIEEVQALPGYQKVFYSGVATRGQVAEILKQSRVGLLVLHETPSYVESAPIKLFEYMAAGIPVVASDFPQWRSLLQGTDCALFVNPYDEHEIAAAVRRLLENPTQSRAMGLAGREAIDKRFSWETQQTSLIQAYEKLLENG